MAAVDYSLYLVTDQDLMSTDTLEEAVRQACIGGVTLVQIREKHAADQDFLETAKRIKQITDEYGVGLIVNDNAHIAAEIGALGVHVGQDDMPAPEVRAIVGPDAIVGVSAHTVEQALLAQQQGADYLGIGGLTFTATKPENEASSMDDLDAIMAAVDIPCVVIGGVNANTIPLCKGHDFAGFAIVSAIIAQPDITQAARDLGALVQSIRKEPSVADSSTQHYEQSLRDQMRACAQKVRDTNPLAASITNTVTIDYVANAQIAVGGSAAMVYLPDEGEFCAQGQGMYINLGTLMPVYEQTIPRTVAKLAECGTPWALDPVAIGIGSLRTELLRECAAGKPAVIRCNASEAIALASLWGLTTAQDSGVRGVDSTDSVSDARAAAIALARFTGGAVAVSGEEDLVTDGTRVALVSGGSKLLTCITGSGCSLGGVAAIYATSGEPFAAALCATAVYNLAANKAERVSDAPASFKVAFLDELYRATAEEISAYPFVLEQA